MTQHRLFSAALAGSLLSIAIFAGCSVHSEEGKNGKDKVNIKTPFGSLKVNEDVDPRDTGLPLYAGAQPYKENNDGHSAANVNIDSSFLGLKVVAAEFTSSDSPDKVRDYYRNALKSYGKVVECKGGYVNVNRKPEDKGDHQDDSGPVNCDDVKGDNQDEIQLKVGTNNHQRVVGVRPQGSGSRFALVYVNARGGKETGS